MEPLDRHAYDLPPPSPESGKSLLQFAGWGNRGSQLAVVWKNDLYYYYSVITSPVQLTNDGKWQHFRARDAGRASAVLHLMNNCPCVVAGLLVLATFHGRISNVNINIDGPLCSSRHRALGVYATDHSDAATGGRGRQEGRNRSGIYLQRRTHVGPMTKDNTHSISPEAKRPIITTGSSTATADSPRRSARSDETLDGVPDVVFNGIPDWVYEEEILLSNKAMWFSPSGERLCFAKFNDSKVDIQPIPRYGSELDPKSNQYTRIENLRYPKPGRAIPSVELFVFKTLPKEGDSSVPPAVPVKPPQSVRGKEYYVTIVSWVDESRLFVNFLHRSQTQSVLAICWDQNHKNAAYECTESQKEVSRTGWVELTHQPVFDAERQAYFMPLPVNDGLNGKFLHVAKITIPAGERDYLTHGSFDIVSIKAYDKKNKYVYFLTTREDAPGEQHLYRVKDTKEDDKGLECLTCDLGAAVSNMSDSPGAGSIEVECSFVDAHFSPTADFYIRECLGPGIPSVALVATHNNTVVEMMDTNDRLRELVEKRAMPQVRNFSAPLTEKYNAAVRLLLPPGLRDEEIIKYPMVVDVYAGPGSMAVQERFMVNWGHYLASKKNIIYATIDVRGSSRQGETRMHEVYKRLGTIEVADQLAVVRYLKSELHFIQEDHVALQGWSYGGYVTALALAQDSESDPVFCCGISIAPVSQWLYYDAVYAERYMQHPNQNVGGYETADLTRQVENIKNKKFFLIHGTLDDNVHYQQSMMLVQALVKKDVIFSSLTYPDQRHQLSGVRAHLYRSMENFFDQCFNSNNAEEIGLMTVKARDRR
ncbi:inactive dipeptidyl peptidase 10-like [Tropilaelaps mercedesae]|uniref:Venom dipeptidyl peptidase 4 n=1 Tax=Tropilaelaps mercedesae TaxID=418985 RepID=A0A1V9WZ33_9ACAR|nr:inactive dipeptidyl peptidase 10-like [Tropilaelaps mercedesae]